MAKGKLKAPEPAPIQWVGGSFEEAIRRWQESPAFQRYQEVEKLVAAFELRESKGLLNMTKEERDADLQAYRDFCLLWKKARLCIMPNSGLVRELVPILQRIVEPYEPEISEEVKSKRMTLR